MYNEFFGFKESPFSIVPNPKMLLLTEQHKEALAHFIFSIHSDGIVLMIGESGVGKTTLIRLFLEQNASSINTALVIHPHLSATEMMQTVCCEFGIEVEQNLSFRCLLDKLWKYLLKQHGDNKSSVLIIDEAHNLSDSVMEMIRMLSNLETTDAKLLQIVLIGQQELSYMLSRVSMRQIKQRVVAKFYLKPIKKEIVTDYIKFRLNIAGKEEEIFSLQACKYIAIKSKGIPRVINMICNRLLLAAYSKDLQTISARFTKEIISKEKLGFSDTKKNAKSALKAMQSYIGKNALLVLLIASVFSFAYVLSNNQVFDERQFNQAINNKNNTREDFDKVLQKNKEKELVRALAQNTLEIKNPSLYAKENLQRNINNTNNIMLGAENAIFEMWGLRNNSCQNMPKNMMCLKSRVGFDDFLSLNIPAIIEYKNKEYAVVSMNSLKAIFVSQHGEKIEISTKSIAKHWDRNVKYILPRFGNFDKRIRKGDAGESVKWLMKTLASMRGAMGNKYTNILKQKTDNKNFVFDSSMKKIVKSYQKNNNLTVDGVVGISMYISIIRRLDKNIPSIGK
jgi:general secretion pathway protein A